MPESLSKVLLIAGGAALTCFVIGLLVYAGGQGGSLASAVISSTAGVTDKLTNSDIKQYSDNVVTGAEVLNAIRNYQDQMSITVTTLAESGAATDTTYTGTERIENVPYLADGSANTKYINPYAKFNSSVSVNANGVSSGLQFEQRSYVALADTGQLVGDGSSSGSSTGSGTSGGSTGVDYTTLQDVVNSQSAAIADLATMLESSNAGNSATLDALKDQLAQLSTEQSELAQAMADMKVSIEDLQDLSVKIDALEGQIGSIGGDGGVFDQDGTFTFRAGKTYYLSAIACGGTGGTGGPSDYVPPRYICDGGGCGLTGDYYQSLVSGAGGNRGQYVIRKELKFDKDTQVAFIIGTNNNNGNTVITFETGEVITLTKGGGGGGAAALKRYGAPGSNYAGLNGGGGAGGFYKTTMKDFTLVNGSGTKGGNGIANVTTAVASSGGGCTSIYTGNGSVVASASGAEGGYGYGAGGGGGGASGLVGTRGTSDLATGAGGKGAPGVVIIETE